MLPETHYARRGDAHIAYQVSGDSPLDLLELPNGTNISIDETPEEPHWERYVRRLASFSRLIRFDMRGVGLSDPLSPAESPTLESTVDDALAVLDAAGVESVALLGPGYGGAVGILMAATHPDRVKALVLVNSTARWTRTEDYPYGYRPEDITQWSEATRDTTGTHELPEELNDAVLFAPSLAPDPGFRQWWSRASRRGAGPATARALAELYNNLDVRAALSSVAVPTLVVHRRQQSMLPIGHAQYLADHLPDAHFVPLPGSDTLQYSGDIDQLLEPVEEFLTGERQASQPDRVLATIMFSDIVGSTEQVAELGDRRWHDVLVRHDAMVERQVERFHGRLVKHIGDGALATFDGPARAISCARSMVEGASQLGIKVRVGLHSGEVEVLEDDVAGIAVHIASRVADLAGSGEVLVSRTVGDLVAGSGIEFSDRGEHELKGVPGTWRVLQVMA